MFAFISYLQCKSTDETVWRTVDYFKSSLRVKQGVALLIPVWIVFHYNNMVSDMIVKTDLDWNSKCSKGLSHDGLLCRSAAAYGAQNKGQMLGLDAE